MKRMPLFSALDAGLLLIAADFTPAQVTAPPPQVNCPLPDYRNGSDDFRWRAFRAWAFGIPRGEG